MPADTSILMAYRPAQIEMPDVQNARIAQLRNAEQQNMLGAIQLGEAARSNQIRNNLRKVLGEIDPNMPEDKVNALIDQELVKSGDLNQVRAHRKNVAEIQAERLKGLKEQALTNKADVETKIEKTKLFTTQLPIIAQNPTDQALAQWAKTLMQNDIMGMEQATAGMNEMLKLPLEQRRQKLMESALSAEKALEQHYMQVDSGDKTTIYGMPKYGGGKASVVQETQEGLSPFQKRKLELEQGKFNLDRYKASKGDGSGSEAPKLKQGERWNKELGRVEAVPGSDIFVKQSGAHGKDLQALQGVDTKIDSAIGKIDYILSPENKSGFESNFGGYNAYAASRLPGKATDVRKNIDSLKSDLKAAGLELMRSGGSIGQITEREWPIIEGMIGALSPEMSEEEARRQFTKIKSYMENIRKNSRDAYDAEWGETQYHKGSKKPPSPPATGNAPPRTNSKGWTLHTDAKGNQAYVSPDGKSFEEVKK
jgi:hypothetical protein